MIARLRGEIVETGLNRLVVDCGGVGYEVFVSESLATALGIIGNPVDLYIRHIVRETDQTLYGFLTSEEKRLFDLLREVKGCGAKISQAVLGTLGKDSVIHCLQTQDAQGLAKTPGVGPRLAERIVVELKDKVFDFQFDARVAAVTPTKRSEPLINDDLVEALIALGYRRPESEEAAEQARPLAESLPEQLRHALKILSK